MHPADEEFAPMSSRIATVREFMTSCPETIEDDEPLAVASRRMAERTIRHLPVVHDDRLVGIVSDRDVNLTDALFPEAAPRAHLCVRDAMNEVVFTCGPDAHLHAVAAEMASERIGSAVIVDREHPLRVLGVFTSTDALRALATLAPQE